MEKLKLIEDELVPVYETDTGEKVVCGAELHKCVGSKQDYSHWVKNRIAECDAVENRDFTINLSKSTGGRPKKQYIIKLDTAKEMAMLERERFTSNKERFVEGGVN